MSAVQSQLFLPSLSYVTGFMTSPIVHIAGIAHVNLADDALGVTKVTSGTDHAIVPDPETNENAWVAVYPKGCYKVSGGVPGGFRFYLAGPPDFASKLSIATGILTSYSVRFDTDWEWNRGGKLPGQYGGVGDLAFACTGGRQENRDQCFDLRFMWRTDGAGELYAYLPLTDGNSKALSQVLPTLIKDPNYGFSVGCGAWTFHTGAWNVIAEHVQLNDPGQENGMVEIWINGTSVICVEGLEMRKTADSVFRGMHFQTFFGGSTPDWASPKTQNAWFTDISGAIIS